jgi:hypothetical protein
MFAKHLNRYFEENKIQSKAVSLHPGTVNTKIMKEYTLPTKTIASCFLKKPKNFAKTSMYCALLNFNELKGGAYYYNCAEAQSSANSNNVED